MKKINFAALGVAFLALFASCQKDDEANNDLMQGSNPVVTLKLSGGNLSKAFFDNTSQAEEFEKSISTLSVLVFDSNDNLLLRRNFSSAEIASLSCSFKLPKTVSGTVCQFYAVANYNTDDITSKSALLTEIESSASDYNGDFAVINSSAKRNGGFVMSGQCEKQIGQMGTSTSVSVTLRRTVAKIAVKIKISDMFDSTYGGKLTILSSEISNAPRSSYIIEPKSSSLDITTDYSFIQEVSSGTNNLFYIYENKYIQNHSAVELKINALYDIDGNDQTTSDRREVNYAVPLNGTDSGIIQRNAYYRISANISGLEGEDCALSVSVADWEIPSTQEVVLGI